MIGGESTKQRSARDLTNNMSTPTKYKTEKTEHEKREGTLNAGSEITNKRSERVPLYNVYKYLYNNFSVYTIFPLIQLQNF